MLRHFLFSILFISGACTANPFANIPSVEHVQDCFRAPFHSYDSWVEMLSKKPGFNPKRFPFSAEEFNSLQQHVTCVTFVYDVDNVKVDGFATYPTNMTQPLPVLVYNRGGNGGFGRVVFGRMLYDLMPMAKEGFLVIGSQYRWSGTQRNQDTFEANGNEDQYGGIDVNDVTTLISYLPKVKIADSTRLGLWGGSRGGMQSYLVAKEYPHIGAMVIKAGLSDVFSFRDRDAKAARLLATLIPDYAENEQAELTKRSAVLWPDQLPRVPTLLIHARDDERVDFSNSTRMAEAFKDLGVEHELMAFDTGGHSLAQHREAVFNATLQWFKRTLQPTNSDE